jgi:hypothetical protein
LRSRRDSGRIDLEAFESALRGAMLSAGASVLDQLLRYDPPDSEHRLLPCPCGQQSRYQEMRSRHLLTALGPVQLTRPYYLCDHCHHGQFPADTELDVAHTEFSPAVRRMLALVGQQAPFNDGRQQMHLLAGLHLTTKSVERTAEDIGADIATKEKRQLDAALQLDLPIVVGEPIPVLYIEMDGTGVPVVKAETQGRPGKIAGQPAHTREAKLGCVFTQTTHDKEGYALRDPDSTTYTGAIETATEFGKRLYLEAWNRGWSRALTKVILGDGAEWIWNIASQQFPGAIQIVDLYHARQHLWNLARGLYPLDQAAQRRWVLRHQPKLDGGLIEKLVAYLRSVETDSSVALEIITAEAAYFEKNAARMRYPEFRQKHLFVGSGVIEAGCKTVIGQRLKQSGMFWTVRGANAILALRCCHLNARFESYWEARAV